MILVWCKWVFKLKLNSDGSISRYKAKLVVKGFHQQAGVDLGPLNHFLRIQITPTSHGLTLAPSKNTSNVLHKFHMENSKAIKTPCCPSTRLVYYDGVTFLDPTEYRSMVGAL